MLFLVICIAVLLMVSESLLDSPACVSQAEPDGDHCDDDRGARVEAVTLDRVCRCLAGVVRGQSDRRRPGDATRGVPEQEPPPVHAREAGDPGDGVTQDGDEAAQEHRLAPMAVHEGLGAWEDAGAVLVQPTPAPEERATAEAADQPVAEVV